MYLDIDGELVVVGGRARAELIRRLLDAQPHCELAIALARAHRDGVVEISPDAPRGRLAAILGYWHAEIGVLPTEIANLRDALAAAAVRRRSMPRQHVSATLIASTQTMLAATTTSSVEPAPGSPGDSLLGGARR